MIVRENKEVHPLRMTAVTRGGAEVFKLNGAHKRSWFILDLALPGKKFIPAGSGEALTTSDGLAFYTERRRQGRRKG